MRVLILCLSFFFFLNNTQGQSPYNINWKTEQGIVGTIGVLGAFDIAANLMLGPLSDEDISRLDISDINSFDRCATGMFSYSADHRSDITLFSAIGLGTLFPLYTSYKNAEPQKEVRAALEISVLWLETNLIAELGTDLIKSTVRRTRPFVYNSEVSQTRKYSTSARKSFVSGHVSLSATNSFFFAKVFSDYYPDSKFRPLVWTVAAAIPAWTATDRVLAGRHFPSDVIAGYILGASCGYLIPHLHKKQNSEQTIELQAAPFTNEFGNGLSLLMIF